MNKTPLIIGVVAAVALIFALTRKAHAEGLTFTDFVINPTKVNPGDSVTISCLASNTGTETITYVVNLGGDFMASKTITLAPGESQLVGFTVTAPAGLGVYHVSIDGLSGDFTVTKEAVADIQLSNLVISPTEVNPGDTVSISVQATNYGDASGSRTIMLTVT